MLARSDFKADTVQSNSIAALNKHIREIEQERNSGISMLSISDKQGSNSTARREN